MKKPLCVFVGSVLFLAGPSILTHADPKLADPELFQVELYADFSSLGGNLKAFGLTLTSGEQGFPSGLYVTSGPAGDARSDRLVRVNGPGQVEVVKDGFVSNEQMVFSTGLYPSGMLISIPLEQRIVQLLPDGTLNTFATGFTPPFGPSGLWFDTEGVLFAADNSSSNVIRVDPQGSTSIFAQIPSENTLGAKGGCGFFCGGGFGGGGGGRSFFVATFSAPGINPPGAGGVFFVSEDIVEGIITVTKLAGGLDGIELPILGPGGVFGADLFVPTIGGADNADGVLYTLTEDGKLTPFMTGLDAVSVAFDTENILGGGMFVSDINDGGGAGKIWRVTIIPEVASIPVDIKPQSCPNPLNVKSKGILPVAVLGTMDFSVTDVDVTTVQLEGISPLREDWEDVATPFEPLNGEVDVSASTCTDRGPDGFTDLTLKFDTQEIVAALGDVRDGEALILTFTGRLLDRTLIQGEDIVVIRKKGKK